MFKSRIPVILNRLKVKSHEFYFSFALCIGVIFGFLIFSLINLDFFKSSVWLSVFLVIIIICLFFKRTYLLGFMFMAGIILAGFLMCSYNDSKASAETFVGQVVTVKGTVSEDPDISEHNSSIRISTLSINNSPINTKIYVSLNNSHNLRRSDEVELSGKMTPGFGTFAATIYNPKISKITEKPDIIRDIRDKFADKIREYIPSTAADLGLGYLLGQKNSLPVELETALRATALTHIVVASGYNLTILTRFARRFFIKVSKNFAMFISVVMVCGFVLMIGFSPSMTRAGLVAILSLIAWYFGRKFNPLFLLIFVAAVTLIISPGNIYDLGWQLSFASFFGVMILAPLLKNYFFGDSKDVNSLVQIFFETLSAQLVTLPLILYTFGVFSTVSIFANLAVLPLVPAAMLFAFLTGVFGFILPILAPLTGYIAKLILDYSIYAIYFFANVTGAQFSLNISPYGVVVSYFCLVIACLYLNKRTKNSFTQSNVVI